MRERCGDRFPSSAARPERRGGSAHGARAGASPARCPGCQEITPLQDIRFSRDLPRPDPFPLQPPFPRTRSPEEPTATLPASPGPNFASNNNKATKVVLFGGKFIRNPACQMHVTGQFHLLASFTDPRKKSSRAFALLTPPNPINNASQTAKHLLIAPKEKSFRKVNWELSGFPTSTMNRADRPCLEFHCG